MEHTELVQKYVDGEIDDTAFNTEFEKLDDTVKKTVTEELKAAKPKILSEISGLRKEREKVKEQKIEVEKAESGDFVKKFRGEQQEKAMKRFFADKSVEEADQAVIRANFVKLDDGAIDADLIFENVKRVFAYSFPDKIFKAKEAEGEEGAAAFMSRQAGSAGRSGAPVEIKNDDPRIARILSEARKEGIEMTADEAKRGLAASATKWSGLKPLTK